MGSFIRHYARGYVVGEELNLQAEDSNEQCIVYFVAVLYCHIHKYTRR